MTPDRDALLARRPTPAASRPAEVPAPAAEEIVDAVRRVPSPRPEVLARVLEGLRDLPTAAADDRAGRTADDAVAPLPLPRRRS